MLIFSKSEDLTPYIKQLKNEKHRVGFIPTMGALHSGHLSLIKEAQDTGHTTICSIFVNPAQFTNAVDIETYPRSIEEDIRLLTEVDCNILFLPSEEEIYPDGIDKSIKYDLGEVERILEGKYRPGHFQGVALIIEKLLRIVDPDTIFLGQKDYQQCIVISRLIESKGLGVEVSRVATKREADGLAMSSRNRRMTPTQRNLGGIIYQCLVSIQAKQNEGNFPVVQKECFDILTKKGFQCDYVELADADTLELLDNYDFSRKMVALIAASIGDIRLIDNLIL